MHASQMSFEIIAMFFSIHGTNEEKQGALHLSEHGHAQLYYCQLLTNHCL